MKNRRSFIRWSILGLFFSHIFTRQSSVFAQSNKGYQKVGTMDELDKKGFILNEDFALGSIMVVRRADKSIIAVDPSCPHSGCTVDWKKNGNNFVCPCHNSKFKADGKKISGIASSDLKTYDLKIEQKNIFVRKK